MKALCILVPQRRIERPTYPLGGGCSIHWATGARRQFYANPGEMWIKRMKNKDLCAWFQAVSWILFLDKLNKIKASAVVVLRYCRALISGNPDCTAQSRGAAALSVIVNYISSWFVELHTGVVVSINFPDPESEKICMRELMI